MRQRFRTTVAQVFGFSMLALLVGLGLLYLIVMRGSSNTVLDSAVRYRQLAGNEVARRVNAYLNEAPMAITHLEMQMKYGLVDPRKMDSVADALLSLLLANDNISEASFTFADSKGFDADGNIIVNKQGAGQVAFFRSTDGKFTRRLTWFDGKQFVAQSTAVTPGPVVALPGPGPFVPAVDPTQHLTFQTTADKANYGQAIWTDLHWSQIDEGLPEAQRRVEVSVQKTIEDTPGHFAGVLRVGLMKEQIDGAVRQPLTDMPGTDPHIIFLCDNDGRLIAGGGQNAHVTVFGDDLRIAPKDVPPVVALALKDPALQKVASGAAHAGGSFDLNGENYLCTFRPLPGTQDWIVGIVVPRQFYLAQIIAIRHRVLGAMLILIMVIVVSGVFIIRAVLHAHAMILRETARMKEFEFAPSNSSSRLRDINDVLTGLEKAKTAMRAMSKYVPVKLVRQLYHDGVEPQLGGISTELSVMFSDIRNFTEYAEQMPPDQLAEVLGCYLEIMATTIQEEKGTIDKYIGDAVMAFWNAPEPLAGHEILACRAALRSLEALQALYALPRWKGRPKFETRIGLHRCAATVGHFGAPDRFNFTAIGDGINLASRLEGLNKYYGTHIIASETIHAAAKQLFDFRLLDRVAVKGKAEGVVIYELLAMRNEGKPRAEVVTRYEEAFALYQKSDFASALRLLEPQRSDGPSDMLAQRCAEFMEKPPQNWDGVHVFNMK